jgi:hypothetical protein
VGCVVFGELEGELLLMREGDGAVWMAEHQVGEFNAQGGQRDLREVEDVVWWRGVRRYGR